MAEDKINIQVSRGTHEKLVDLKQKVQGDGVRLESFEEVILRLIGEHEDLVRTHKMVEGVMSKVDA